MKCKHRASYRLSKTWTEVFIQPKAWRGKYHNYEHRSIRLVKFQIIYDKRFPSALSNQKIPFSCFVFYVYELTLLEKKRKEQPDSQHSYNRLSMAWLKNTFVLDEH